MIGSWRQLSMCMATFVNSLLAFNLIGLFLQSYILACWYWTTTIASNAVNVDISSQEFSLCWDRPYLHDHLFHTYMTSKNFQMINVFWLWISVVFLSSSEGSLLHLHVPQGMTQNLCTTSQTTQKIARKQCGHNFIAFNCYLAELGLFLALTHTVLM